MIDILFRELFRISTIPQVIVFGAWAWVRKDIREARDVVKYLLWEAPNDLLDEATNND